jgi:hypothetical protein
MSAKTAMKIQIAMNQKKKTIRDAKMSVKVIAWSLLEGGRRQPGPDA